MGPLSDLKVPPEGGHLPQPGDRPGDRPDDLIHRFFRRVLPEGEPQRAVGDLVGPADREQHMARVEGPAGAGGARRGADAGVLGPTPSGTLLSTRETVALETPAIFAISSTVTLMIFPAFVSLSLLYLRN